MKEVRFHGKGGQGVVIAAHILGTAFVAVDKYASSFPLFGVERRGAPVSSFLRFDDKPIREKCKIYHPDCLIILDPTELESPLNYEGLKPGSTLVRNLGVPSRAEEKLHENIRIVATIDASKIAMEEIGVAASNTCMLGAFARATDWIGLDLIIEALSGFFWGDRLEANVNCCRRGFHEAELTDRVG
jgi:2-oxoacid:acceptor oxidoreductase gamma subunit (pyruvate/2-ketoisovalerate family)